MNKDENDIWDDLKEKRSGFKTPKSYFDNFEVKFPDDHEESASNVFKVPEGYFEDFQLDQQKLSQPKLVSLRSHVGYKILALSAAAAILLFVGIKSKTSTGAPLQWQELSDSDISYWLENDSGELNSYDIAEVYHDVSLEPEFVSDEELNDYLNEIDLEQIISE